MIEFEMMRQLLCSEYDGLREKVVAAADDWIGAKGEFIPHLWVRQLCILVQDRFLAGDHEQADRLFVLVEILLTDGDAEVKSVIATGFLEGLINRGSLPADNWRPFLGPLARKYCETVDRFHGINR